MKDEIIRMIFGVLICGTFAGGFVYLDYWFKKKDKERHKKKAG